MISEGVVWFGFDEGTGEFNGEYSTVKPHDTRSMIPFVRASAISSQSLSLSEAREENARKDIEIERLKKLSDRYGVALMMIRAGCSDPARFAGNILDDRQPVNVELDEEDFDENHR